MKPVLLTDAQVRTLLKLQPKPGQEALAIKRDLFAHPNAVGPRVVNFLESLGLVESYAGLKAWLTPAGEAFVHAVRVQTKIPHVPRRATWWEGHALLKGDLETFKRVCHAGRLGAPVSENLASARFAVAPRSVHRLKQMDLIDLVPTGLNPERRVPPQRAVVTKFGAQLARDLDLQKTVAWLG